jgi:hypothetical protein
LALTGNNREFDNGAKLSAFWRFDLIAIRSTRSAKLKDQFMSEQQRKSNIERLRAAFQQGEESGSAVPAEEVFDRLEAKYARLVAEQKS